MRTVFLAILVHHPLQHLSATVIIKVGINIWEVDTVRIEKTLKQKVIFQWVYLRDTQAISHDRAGRGATPRSYPNAKLVAGRVDEVLHNEEVARETHRLHDMKLKLHMLPHIVGDGVAIALLRAVISQFGKIVGLKLDAIDLVVATQALYHGIRLVFRQRVLTVLVGGELLIKLFLRVFLMPLLLGSETLRDGEERHDWSVVDTVDLHLIQDLQGV